jgi:TRAP-type C4-dicarboxylate transport system substrate-binding protein
MKKILLTSAFILVLLSLVLGACAAPTTAPGKVMELKFSYWPPPADKWVQRGILPWGPELEKKTNGAVKVTYFGGSTLGAPPDHLDLVMKGTCDIGWINPAFTPSVFPLTDVRNLPFIYPTVQVAAKVFWRQQVEILNELEYKDKIKVLWTFPTPPMECSTRTKQIKTLEDLKGMKFGDTEPMAAETSKAMGAVPVILMENDLYTGLERGMLDGRWQEYNGLVTWKCGEVTKYRTDNIRIFVHQNLIGMNLAKYNSLPANIKKAIDETTGFDRSAEAGNVWAQCEKESREQILAYDKKMGNPEPYVLPEAERARFIQAAQPAVDAWLAEMGKKGLGDKAKDLLAKTKQWVQEYSK